MSLPAEVFKFHLSTMKRLLILLLAPCFTTALHGFDPSISDVEPAYKKESHSAEDPTPNSFDARTAWPQCVSIGRIYDQSNCQSSWALASASAITDRVCIAQNDPKRAQIYNPILSANDLLACCGFRCGSGCAGGYPMQAYRYWIDEGLVTGGAYADNSTCYPYAISPCGIHKNQPYYRDCPASTDPTPKCERQCQSSYDGRYSPDKHYGKSAQFLLNSADTIKQEILRSGPVTASMQLYEDFMTYRQGVYWHKSGKLLTDVQSVKILGWGVDSQDGPYWICANSWGTEWGEKGFFRIRRGTGECLIETAVIAGTP